MSECGDAGRRERVEASRPGGGETACKKKKGETTTTNLIFWRETNFFLFPTLFYYFSLIKKHKRNKKTYASQLLNCVNSRDGGRERCGVRERFYRDRGKEKKIRGVVKKKMKERVNGFCKDGTQAQLSLFFSK